MPIQKKKYAPKRKVIRRKRLARRGYPTNVNRSLQPIPQRSIIKMKWSEAVNITMTNATSGRWVYRLNSIFDPDQVSGTNHKPYGYDTMLSLYNRYRVIGCSYTLSIDPETAINMQLVALPSNEVVTATTASIAKEKPRAKFLMQEASGATIRKLTGYVSIPSLVGRNKTEYMSDDRYQAQFGANPQEEALLNVFLGGVSDNAISTTVSLNATLEYTVECFDVKPLGVSV